VQQRGDPAAGCRQAVVLGDGRAGLVPDHFDIPPGGQGQGFGGRLEAELASPAEHDYVRVVVEQLGQVGRLDPGTVVGAGLGPVPTSAAARPQLGVPEAAQPVDVDEAPAVTPYRRRRIGGHHISVEPSTLGARRLAAA
jgi:hypothetical protein